MTRVGYIYYYGTDTITIYSNRKEVVVFKGELVYIAPRKKKVYNPSLEEEDKEDKDNLEEEEEYTDSLEESEYSLNIVVIEEIP